LDSAVKKRKLNDDSSDSDMGISEFDSTLENEPGTSASSDSKLPEAFCTFNVFDPSPQKSDLTSISKVQALSDLSLPTEI
jgi:hypothetical protein